MPNYREIDLEQLRALAVANTSIASMARQLNCGIDTIYDRLRKLGLERPKRSWTPRPRDARGRIRASVKVEINLKLVTELRDMGLSLKDIARKLGLSYGTLSKRTAAAGIKFSPGMTKLRWEKRRANCKEAAATRDDSREQELARRQALQMAYLDAVVEEESLPRYLRGRAAQLRAAMEGRAS